MMRFKLFWRGTILALGLSSFFGYGRIFADTPTQSMTIEQAVEAALRENFTLGREAIDLASRKRQSDNAFAGLLPTVNLSAGLSRNNGGLDTTTGGQIPWTNANSLGISLNLALSSWTDLETAKMNYETGKITYASARRTIEKSVRTAFYSLLLQQANLRLEEQSYERACNQFQQIAESHRAGLVSDLDFMTVQVTMLAAQAVVESQHANLAKQMGQFRQLLRLPIEQVVTLSGELGADVPQGFIANLPFGTESADILAMKTVLSGTERILSIQKWNQWLPTVSLSWNWAPSRADLANRSTIWTDSTGGLSLGLSFTLNNLLPWSSAAETAAQSNDQIRKYQSQIAELFETQNLNRRNNLLQIQQSLQAIDRMKMTVSLAERAYALNSEAYQKGTKDWLSLQNIEGERQKAGFNLVLERYNLMMALLNFENDENIPFGTVMGGLR